MTEKKLFLFYKLLSLVIGFYHSNRKVTTTGTMPLLNFRDYFLSYSLCKVLVYPFILKLVSIFLSRSFQVLIFMLKSLIHFFNRFLYWGRNRNIVHVDHNTVFPSPLLVFPNVYFGHLCQKLSDYSYVVYFWVFFFICLNVCFCVSSRLILLLCLCCIA